MDKMGVQLSDWVENIVGKGEIARYAEFGTFGAENVQRRLQVDLKQIMRQYYSRLYREWM